MRNLKKLLSLVLALTMLLCLCACGGSAPSPSGSGSEPGADEAPGSEDGSKKLTVQSTAADFCGAWKYDSYDDVIVINDDGTVDVYDVNETYQGTLAYKFADETLTTYGSDGTAGTAFTLSDGDKLQDNDGDTLSPFKFTVDLSTALPAPSDPLTLSLDFPETDKKVTVSYPETMEGHVKTGETRTLSFSAVNEDGTDDYFTNIQMTLLTHTGYDDYFDKGYDTAKVGLQKLLDDYLTNNYSKYLIKSIGADFKDGGTYYEISGFVWFDGSFFAAVAPQPVRGVVTLRYYGPNNYVLAVISSGVQNRIHNYYEIANKMLASIDYGGDWSTAPKARPVTAGAPANGSDPGDYGTPYYWYDGDGDVWYWNGYQNEFIGYGGDYYIDGNQYYESNDAGWDGSEYDYYDDYDPWSDPGDGNDAWSDPGDSDYYEANDAGWN